jgi:polar amino acid transport system substrate-binding protein
MTDFFKWLLLLFCFFRHFDVYSEKILIVTEPWPPFNYINQDNQVVGIATEVLKKVMRQAGFDYIPKPLQYAGSSWS